MAINKQELIRILIAGCDELSLKCDLDYQQKILSYIELIIKWNKIYNLTAITDPKAIVIKHILDSVSIANYICGDLILDVGSGAGFPGVPLALLFPEKRFVLLDANSKKCRFLTYVKAQLNISNIEIVHSRVEQYQPSVKFTSVVTRAFAAIPDIIKLTQHLYASNGMLLAMKGRVPQEELAGLNDVVMHRLQVPLLDEERHLICVSNSAK